MADISPALHRAVADLLRDVAAEVILPRFRRLAEDEVMRKAADDVVTIADQESEAVLTERLTALLPEATVIGEEAAHAYPAMLSALGDRLCWIVDPLDGTRNFAAGRTPFGMILALSDGGDTLAGWIYDPLKERLCHTVRGGGAFIDGTQVTAHTSGARPPVAAVSLVFADADERAGLLERIGPDYRLVDIPYCSAEQYPRLALGENDVSLFKRTLPWDHAAGTLWLNEAGGHAARLDGGEYRPGDWDRPGLIGAASPALWEAFAARVSA